MTDYVGAILAAGRGNRMGVLGDQYPKPLLPIANEPLIVHHIQILRDLGIRKVYVVVGYKGAQIADALGDGTQYGVQLIFLDQGPSLGSAHALGRLAPIIDDPFVLLLGDYYFSAPKLAEMFAWAKSSGSSAMAAKREPDRQALCEACILELDAEERVLRITEKPKLPISDLKGCGIYIFRPEIFDAIRQTPRTALRDEYELTISIDIYIKLGYKIYAKEIIDWDMNLTRPEDVLQCNLNWLKHQDRIELVDPEVQLPVGSRLERAIIGANVTVERPSVLKDVIVFSGTQIRGGWIEHALVTPTGLISCNSAQG
jgi:NDP-sugar pyrophosphorylase family protein